jgi:hypothetical protein
MANSVFARIRKNWTKVYFTISIAAIVFAYGFGVAHFKIFPHSVFMSAFKYYQHNQTLIKNEFPGLNPTRYEGSGVVVNEKGRTYPGVTLIGVPLKEGKDWSHSVRLVDMDGTLLHKWTIDPETVWDESPHQDLMRGKKSTKFHTHIHGVVLLPEGHLVFNLSHYGLLRVNACSEIIWKVPYRTHHSVYLDDNGDFWAAGEKWHTKPVEQYPGLSTPFIEDTIVQVSPDGEIKREISILASLYRSGYEGLLFASYKSQYKGDVTHNNDAEVLEKRLAGDFMGLNAGDIMVSLRNISTVLIIDGETELVKWSMTHPFHRQHDPDFVQNGFIYVYDNRPDPKKGNAPSFGGSRILRVRPFTNDVLTIFLSQANNQFYSRGGGKHQQLGNGNLLITEPYGGRVFEVTAGGDLVWSWIAEKWDDNDKRLPEVFCGIRYPESFADFPKKCS